LSTAHDVYQRLLKIEQLLTQTIALGGGNSADASPAREALAQRVRLLSGELKQSDGREPDEFDAITMRLLLNDYVLLVSTLRTLAREAETKVLSAGRLFKESRKRFEQQEKLKLRREARETKG